MKRLLAVLLMVLAATTTAFAGGPDIGTTGTIAAENGAVTLPLTGQSSASCVITGTWAGTLVPEVSVNGSTWVAVTWYDRVNNSVVANTTANGTFAYQTMHGMATVRVRCSVYTSGTATVTIRATDAPPDVDRTAAGTSAMQVQGTADDGAAEVGNPVQVGGVDGSGNAQTLLVDTGGRAMIVGAAADAVAAVGNPILTAGMDGSGNVQTVLVDTSGRPNVVGGAADGAAVAGNPVLTAGVDGAGNAQSVATDTSGRQEVVGGAADGAATAGNPVPVAGVDGAGNVQVALVDTSGRPNVVGAAADGAAAAGNPVLIAGVDGSANAQTLAMDTSGRATVIGGAADGAATAGNPVPVAGVDGLGNAQTLSTDTSGRADVNLVSGQSGITAGAGAVGASTPRVTHASDDPVTTAIQIIDDWDESDRAKVNLIVGQAGIAGGTGVDGATVPRVSLATNVPLPAGSNSIGTVDTELPTAAALADNAANPTAPLVGAALIAYDGATWDRVPNGGGVEAAALRVTVASDSTGVLSVDDNGSTLTVDAPAAAPVAVQLSDGAALQTAAALDTDTGVGTVTRVAMAIAAAASGGPVPVQGGGGTENGALRVTVASDSTGVLSVDDNGASLTVDNAALSVTGGGVEATALRVTVASDSTGVLSVDDNGANISVDWAGTVPPIGAGTEAAALRVTVATDSTGVLSVDDNGAALTVDSAQLPAALGQTTMAASMAVTIASNQSAVTTDTELPAAAALADNAANPTAPTVGAALLAYDGATWDRVQNGAGTAAAAMRSTLASDDPAVVALQIVDDWDETNRAAVNLIAGQVAIAGGTGTDAANVPRVSLATNVALPAGTNILGRVRPVASSQATYRATFSVTAVAGTAVEIVGPSSGTSEIREIFIYKPSAQVVLTLNKRSAASTGGASSNRTLVPLDAVDDAATVTVKQFTGDPTEGALVGEIARYTLGTGESLTWTFGDTWDKPITLNANTQCLTLEVDAGATVNGHIVFTQR